ncbi:helix-turn-helix transcriptional regulator [Streptomyces sp. NBC_00454]|uniref:helix-turn-helix transcriptional regulator n=1 Tax=Streptomyces sp. NBC_00454 TaxID=2975747 RepID=UPI0030E467C1
MGGLEGLGLTDSAERVYRAIVTHPEMGVQEISRGVGMDDEVVRSCMDELADLALVRPTSTARQSVLISPKVALEALVTQRKAELFRVQHELELSSVAASELVAEIGAHPYVGATEGIEVLRGVDEIRGTFERLSFGISSEVLAIIPLSRLDPKGMESSRVLDEDLMQRGVKLQTLYLDSIRNDRAARDYASWLTELGGEVRTAPVLPRRLTVIDREMAIIPVDSQSQEALLVSVAGVVEALIAMFGTIWNFADPLGTSDQRTDEGITSQEQALLRLLGSGLTDEAACKRLGVSLRSVRRMMADLMVRLEAGSRFEAGAKAAQRGWI